MRAAFAFVLCIQSAFACGESEADVAATSSSTSEGSAETTGDVSSTGGTTGSAPMESSGESTLGGSSSETGAVDSTAGNDTGPPTPPPSTAQWSTYEFVCPRGESGNLVAATDVPDLIGSSYVYNTDSNAAAINGGYGSSSGVDADGQLVVGCGEGNDHPPGTELRIALAHPPDADAGGSFLRWETFELTCPEDGGPASAPDVDTSFVAATYAARAADGTVWEINPAFGWSSYVGLEDGGLHVSCGDGNSHRPGDRIRVALGYDDGALSESLQWEFHEFTCDEAGLREAATGIDTGFAAVTYLATRSYSSRWDIHPLYGLSSALTDAGELLIDCGDGNAHELGETIWVGFGYE